MSRTSRSGRGLSRFGLSRGGPFPIKEVAPVESRRNRAGTLAGAHSTPRRLAVANQAGGRRDAPADGCDYFSSATCTLSEPSTVRILARSAWLLLATSTEPSTLALI
jgi:hypothetical protein